MLQGHPCKVIEVKTSKDIGKFQPGSLLLSHGLSQARQLGATNFTFQQINNIIGLDQCHDICQFIEHKWEHKWEHKRDHKWEHKWEHNWEHKWKHTRDSMRDSVSDDFQCTISSKELENLVGPTEVSRMFPDATFRLRRVQAIGQYIPFHLDNAQQTAQVLLNSNFTGGKLTCICENGSIIQPDRITGTMTVHNNKICHGVTRFESGVRYSLFALGGIAW